MLQMPIDEIENIFVNYPIAKINFRITSPGGLLSIWNFLQKIWKYNRACPPPNYRIRHAVFSKKAATRAKQIGR